MKRITLTAALMAVIPATSLANSPTGRHFGVYRYVYRHAIHRFGHHKVGCELVYTCRRRVNDAVVVSSTHTLEAMLHPPAPAPVSATPVNGLVRCIMYAESTNNPQAVSGQYEGYGQWSPTAWAQDGGLRYAPTPLQATPSEQIAVLNAEVAAGTTGQQTNFDPC